MTKNWKDEKLEDIRYASAQVFSNLCLKKEGNTACLVCCDPVQSSCYDVIGIFPSALCIKRDQTFHLTETF